MVGIGTALQWAGIIFIILLIYYIFKAIVPGSTFVANKLSGIADTVRATKKAKRDLDRATRREYRYAKHIKNKFEKLVTEAGKPHPSKTELTKALKNIINELKKAIKWQYLIDDLSEEIENVANDSKKTSLGKQLKAIEGNIKVEIDEIRKLMNTKTFTKAITKLNVAEIKGQAGLCIKRLDNIEKELAGMQRLENKIIDETGNQ